MARHEPNVISPPIGLVTLVFTDVQGSTGIWEHSSEIMRSALAEHDAVMRETLESVGGYEVKTEGDAFMVAFADPLAALRWCLTVQERLIGVKWPPDLLGLTDAAEVVDSHGTPIFRGLRVRMGIHAGVPECKPDPKTGRMDYFGPMVNRAARVGGAAHGGQILVSGTVWSQISSRLSRVGNPVSQDLGEHRLKGLETMERLVMVLPESLAARRFPPPKTLNPNLTNMLPGTTSFIGREAEIAAIDALIARPSRLVTLTGMGGLGKTRLASHYGLTRLEAFSEAGKSGVWFCDVSEATTVPGICEAVGRALQIPLASGKSEETMVAQLGTALADRGRILFIIDNFEQVVQYAAVTVGKWLKMAPDAVFLVTSRESLGLQGEMVSELLPLALPDECAPSAESAAVKLFLERAEAIRSGCVNSRDDVALVGKIVRRLDGIPLAIELAAARMGIFSPADLLARLQQQLGFLAARGGDTPSRQATLRTAIGWSWDLLEPWEQAAGAQCSVFHGGFDLEAAEEILDVSSFPQAPPVFEIIQALRQKSLLRSFEAPEMPGRLRFGMYVTVQEFAREKFQTLPQKDAIFARHAAYYVKMGRKLAPRFPGGGGNKGLRRLAAELENLRAVLHWAVTRVPPTRDMANLGLEAALALDPLFTTRGPFSARGETLDRAMNLAQEAGADPSLMAWACEARGRAYIVAGAADACEKTYERGLVFARESGDKKATAFILRNIGLKRMISGVEMEEAREKYEAAHALLEEVGDKPCAASLLGDIGCYWLASRNLERAVEYLERSRQANQEVGNLLMEGLALTNLGIIYQEMGLFDRAESVLRPATTLGEELGDHRLNGFTHGYLACLFQEWGRFEEAIPSYRRALEFIRKTGDQAYLSLFQAALGSCLACHGDFAEAEAMFAFFSPSRLDPSSQPFAQTEKLHFGVYQAQLAKHHASGGFPERALACAKQARAILAEGKKGALESEDVRFGLRLLTRAVKGLPRFRPA